MNRSRDLFWQLTEPEHLKARGFCRKLMGNSEDGDDLYQDSLVAALTRFESLRETAAFRPWLYRIIVNHFKNRKRQSWFKRVGPLSNEIAETLAGDNPAERHAHSRELRLAFAAVSTGEKALLILFEVEGWSIAELARLHDKTEGAIKVRLSRTRRRMREALVKHRRSTRPATSGSKLSKEKICVAAKPGLD